MTDQNLYGDQPEARPTPGGQPGEPAYSPPPTYASPPQPPSPGAPPPAQPPSPGYAPPPAYGPSPAPPPKKRNVGMVILVVVAVVFCMVATCIGTVAYNVISTGAKTRDAVRQAEEHIDTATAELETATKHLDTFLSDKDSQAQADVSSQLRATRDEIAAARATIEGLPDSEGKTAYLGALDEANRAVEALEQTLGIIRVIVDLSDQVKRAGADVEAGNDALNAAIKAANRRGYSTMKARARVASREYASGAKLFAEAHRSEPTAGLDKVVDYANLRKKQADLIIKMADAGRAGRINEYNRLVDEQAALGDKAEKTGTPDIVSDPQWGSKRIEEQQKVFEEAANRADELRAQALKAFGITD